MTVIQHKFKTINIDKKDRIVTVTLNRPERLNALNREMVEELEVALNEVMEDSEVRVVMITGSGEKAFSAGVDISMLKEFTSSSEARKFFQWHFFKIIQLIENMPKPVIAVINGIAAGGGLELAMACDILLAVEDARIGQPEINIGIVPGLGGMSRLPWMVGLHRAKQIVFTGDLFTAKEAERLGIVNKVVTREDLQESVDDLSTKLLEKSPLMLRVAKETMNHALDVDISIGIMRDIETFCIALTSEDAQEGFSAFLEKRKPIYKNH